MGNVVLGLGFGGAARPAALLHVLNHSVAKVLLFLVAGDLILRFGTQKIRQIHGILRETPLRGVLLFGGILAITGSPPFGAFWSEFGILVGGIAGGHLAVSLAYLVLLAILFGSFLMYGSDMAFGEGVPRKLAGTELWCLLPACVLLLASLWLGLHVPAGLYKTLERLSTVVAFS
ncbi:MAG: proton-conducting transporter transmembrane domain-containing protein, partial [Desulfobacteria bacterium]